MTAREVRGRVPHAVAATAVLPSDDAHPAAGQDVGAVGIGCDCGSEDPGVDVTTGRGPLRVLERGRMLEVADGSCRARGRATFCAMSGVWLAIGVHAVIERREPGRVEAASALCAVGSVLRDSHDRPGCP